jgi:membrane-associated phospholipid phosphatase
MRYSLSVLVVFAASTAVFAQDRPVSWKRLLPNIAKDQKQIWWEYPKDVAHGSHLLPAFLAIGGTAGLIALDPHTEPHFRRTSAYSGFNDVLNSGSTIAMMAAVPAATYLTGLLEHDFYAVRTAQLAAEAVIDAEAPGLVMKGIARRAAPAEIPPSGGFSNSWFSSQRGPLSFRSGGFPSGHALMAFAIATVFADRYRNHRWVKWVAYASAGAIAFSRMTTKSHFPSDVFAGGVIGFATAHFVVLRVP